MRRLGIRSLGLLMMLATAPGCKEGRSSPQAPPPSSAPQSSSPGPASSKQAESLLRKVARATTYEEADHAAIAKLSVAEVLPFLGDSDEKVRNLILRHLGRTGAPDLAPLITPFLKSESSSDRLAAVMCLVDLQAPDPSVHIAPLITDGNLSTQIAAIRALGWFRARPFAPAVAKLLLDPDQRVGAAAASALGWMGAVDHSSMVVQLLGKEFGPLTRCRAFESLADMGARKEIPAIAGLLDREFHHGDRADAIKTLAQLGAREYRDKIASLAAKAESEDVRSEACLALARLGGADEVPRIVPFLRDRDGKVQAAAAWALGWIASPEAEPPLRLLLKHESDRVLVAAMIALAELPPKEAVIRDVQSLERHELPEVRNAVTIALLRWGKIEPLAALERLEKNDRGLVPAYPFSRAMIWRLEQPV
jgi:HEAT repeat protein